MTGLIMTSLWQLEMRSCSKLKEKNLSRNVIAEEPALPKLIKLGIANEQAPHLLIAALEEQDIFNISFS